MWLTSTASLASWRAGNIKTVTLARTTRTVADGALLYVRSLTS